MTRTSSLILILAIVFFVGIGKIEAADVVLGFEELNLPANSSDPADATQTPVVSQHVSFNRTWITEFNCCPGAWVPSTQTDLTTAGVGNAYSAYHLPASGGAEGSAHYMAAFDSTGAKAVIQLPQPTTVRGMYVTNTTYAYLAVVEGRDTAGSDVPAFVKGPFGDDDYFRLDVTGIDAVQQQTGVVEFYLADYRDGKREAVSSWTWLDLTALGDQVATLSFELSSTDNGMFGMNTPSYFAIDELTLADLGSGLLPGDCNGDGILDAGDLACVSTINERDTVLAAIPTLAGDLDGNGEVDFPDFLVLSANFGQDLPSYTAGNIDLAGGVAFPDFLILSANFGQDPVGGATASVVPEPSSLALLGLGGLVLGLLRRRGHSSGNAVNHFGSRIRQNLEV